MSQFTCLNLRLSLPSMLSEPILVVQQVSVTCINIGGGGEWRTGKVFQHMCLKLLAVRVGH